MRRFQRLALMLLFSLSLFVISSGPFSVKAAAADNPIFTQYKTWVEDSDTDTTSWIEGTTSTNGNNKMTIDIKVTEETVTFIGSGGSVGYNAGLFIPLLEISEGDVISFTYTNNLNTSKNNGIFRYGIKTTPDGTGLSRRKPDDLGDDVLESFKLSKLPYQQTNSYELTSNFDGYLFLYAFTAADEPANFTIADLKITDPNGSSQNINFLKDTFNQAISDVNDKIRENFGAVGFAHDTVQNFIGLFQEEPPAPVIIVPPLKMTIEGEEHQFFNGYTYDFRSMEEGPLNFLILLCRSTGTIVLWWAFLQYLQRVYHEIFGRVAW